MTNYKTACAFR